MRLRLSSELPAGLKVMRTDSETLKVLNTGPETFEIKSYAGDYDLHSLRNGACEYFLGDVVHEGFGRNRNDLVVPTDSALGAGAPQHVLKDCDHFHYFLKQEVVKELQALSGPSASAIGA